MAYTVGDLIRAAMRKATILGSGEPIPADEGADALEALTLMVDGWTNETLLIPIVSEIIYQLSADQSKYTIGIYDGVLPIPDNHIETARPEKYLASFLRDGSGTDYPLEIIDVETFARIGRKTNASRPTRFYRQEGWPLDTIQFEAAPYADENLHLYVVQPLAGILPTASLTDIINLPPGYKRGLVYNLALELNPEWGQDPSSLVATYAVESKKWIKRNNYRALTLACDRAIATRRKGQGIYYIDQGP